MKKIFIILTALGFGMASVGEAEAAKVCKSTYYGPYVNDPTKAGAKAFALTNWTIRVTKKYSVQWANWSNASTRAYNCQTKTSAIGLNYYRCRAKAKPCIFQ